MMIEERQPEHDLSKASESLPILTKFLISLGFQLEFENSVLWGRRTVVGESVVVGFHALRSGTTDSIRDARRILARAARTEPGAALHLIATAGTTIPTDESQTFIDTDVKVASEIGYLNGTLLSESLCKTIIEEAEQYVPTAKYVEQRLGPGGALAVPFLNDWMASTERGLLVVLAHAGHGKTCLANHLGRRLAQQHLINDEKPVPFVFPLQRHRNVQRFEELVLTNLQDRGIYGFTSAAFAHLINEGRVLPVLDGFDELAETGGLKVARETLRGLLGHLQPNAKVLLTSRQAYFRHKGDLSLVGSESLLENLETVELRPFDQDSRGVFLRGRGLDKNQIREVESYVNNLGAEEPLASPLMLGFLGDEVKAALPGFKWVLAPG